MTVLLALDTSTETVHLALVAGDEEPHVLARPGGALASAAVLPAVAEILHRAGLQLRHVDAFAFGHGPGAFTGLRMASAVTQGLALGTGRPVIAVSSLMAVAESARRAGAGEGPAEGRVWAAVDARMGEIYAACYCWGSDGHWHTLVEPCLLPPQALARQLGGEAPADLAGSAAACWPELFGPCVHRMWPQAAPSGVALAALARESHARGDLRDAAQAVPVYVRDKVAMTTAERLERGVARVASAGPRGS